MFTVRQLQIKLVQRGQCLSPAIFGCHSSTYSLPVSSPKILQKHITFKRTSVRCRTSKYGQCLSLTHKYSTDPSPTSPWKDSKTIHTLLSRIATLEESMKFYGYSTLRIGLAIIVVAGFGVYIFRHHIRENVAEEVSTVASMSLGDTEVQMRVQELALALIQTLLTNDSIRNQAAKFLAEVFNQPGTKDALISLLLHVLQDPDTQATLTSSLKHILRVSLGDPVFRRDFANNLQQLLQEPSTKQGLLELLSYTFNNETVQVESQKFLQDILASNEVQNEVSKLGKSVLNDIVSDNRMQKKTGDALWSAFTYSVTPSIFVRNTAKNEDSKESVSSAGTNESDKKQTHDSGA